MWELWYWLQLHSRVVVYNDTSIAYRCYIILYYIQDCMLAYLLRDLFIGLRQTSTEGCGEVRQIFYDQNIDTQAT